MAITTSPNRQLRYESTITFDTPSTTTPAFDHGLSTAPASASPDGNTRQQPWAAPPMNTPTPTTFTVALPPNQVGFSFVNVGHPNDAKHSSSKRAIRSHVAKVQHSRARQSGTKPSRAKQVSVRLLHPRYVEPKPLSQSVATIVASPPRGDSSDSFDAGPVDGVEETGQIDKSRQTEADWPDRHDSHSAESTENNALCDPHALRTLANPSIPSEENRFIHRSLQGGRRDPFWSYPIAQIPDLEPMLDHYLVHVVIDLDFLTPKGEKDWMRRQWWPLCMADPAIFWAAALGAAASYTYLHHTPNHKINLMTLKQKAIQHINDALTDPVRSVSDATLGAVMKMAAYEVIWGEQESYKAHMSGLQQLVQLRGGLSNLGLNGLMERMVLWLDSNASHMMGCARQFDKKWFPSAVLHPPADPAHFIRMRG